MKIGNFKLKSGAEDFSGLQNIYTRINQTRTDYPRDKTVPDLFAEVVRNHPDAVALRFADGERSYAQLDAESNRIARFLSDRNLAHGSFIGVMCRQPVEFCCAVLGILKAGYAYFPVDPKTPEDRVRYMLNDAAVEVLFFEKEWVRTANRLQWSCPKLMTIIAMDSDDLHGESEGVGEYMNEEVWDHVGQESFDDISRGGWRSSYTGHHLSREVMDSYRDNIFQKLLPHVTDTTRILEIGCGSGISMFALAPKVGSYHATDLSCGIMNRTEEEGRRLGFNNIKFQHLPAHRTREVSEGDFDIVIINSVLQCFRGVNYLRGVLRQALAKMKTNGIIFLGNVWDQELQDKFSQSLRDFKKNNPGKGYRVRQDWSEVLCLTRGFLEDLRLDFPEIVRVETSLMLGDVVSELSEFGYDAILTIDKANQTIPGAEERHKWQFDRRILRSISSEKIEITGSPKDLAYLMYTSGTTGKPKGVMVEHRSIVRLVRNTNYVTLGPNDRLLQGSSVAFDAMTFELWGMFLNGGCLVWPREWEILDAVAVKKLISENEITIVFMTTGLFNQLVDTDSSVFNGIKYLFVGGEKLSVSHVNRVRKQDPKIVFNNIYGPTENTTFSLYHPLERDYERDIPLGRPIANSQVLILNTELGLARIGDVGEICVGGDGLARGYLKDGELTKTKFINHPFVAGERIYRTGDLGRMLSEGVVEFWGRMDEQLKIRGFRVEPADIEHALYDYGGIKEAVVLGMESKQGGKVLVAYLKTDEAVDIEALRSHLRSVLPEYMVPSYLQTIKSFPLNSSGKIDKKGLPEVREEVTVKAGSAPSTPTEVALAEIWGEVLGQKNISVDDDFFDVGGHSLKVTQLLALVQKRLGVTLSMSSVFKSSTLRELTRCVLAASRFGDQRIDDPMVLLNGGTATTKLFAFPPGTGDALSFVQMAQKMGSVAFYGFNFIAAESRIQDYATLIEGVDPVGPYTLLGYSGGGNLAYHVAGELERRKKRVVSIIMVDSARMLVPIVQPRAEVEKTIQAFLNHDSVRGYLTSPILVEKASRLIESYFSAISKMVDRHVVDADIHVILGRDSAMEYVQEGSDQPLASVSEWKKVTNGSFTWIQGEGDHNRMLYDPDLDANVRIIENLIK